MLLVIRGDHIVIAKNWILPWSYAAQLAESAASGFTLCRTRFEQLRRRNLGIVQPVFLGGCQLFLVIVVTFGGERYAVRQVQIAHPDGDVAVQNLGSDAV